MKIIQISDTTKKLGGAEKVMFDILDILRRNNIKSDIWGSRSENITQSILSVFNIKYLYGLKIYLKNKHYKIFHIHKFNSILSPSIFLAIPKNARIILHVHDFSFYCYKLGITKFNNECKGGIFHGNCNEYNRRIFEFVYNLIKWIKFITNRFFIRRYVKFYICPSRKLRELMIQSLKLDPEKVVYIPNYIDIPKNYFPNLSELESNQLLFVGRLSKEKGIDVSIKAIKTILQTNPNLIIKYEIIGDGPEKYNLENLISNLGLKDYVNLLGRIDNTILKKYYEKSGIIIMPSVWLENNPIVALEAMKSGRPIIASNIGGFPDLIEDGKNGYLFKVGNHIDLAEKIQKLIGNQEKIIQMGSYGFEKVKSEYNSELFFNKLLSLYMKD